MMPIQTLATDLDGTLIPIDDSIRLKNALETLRETLAVEQLELLYVSGRSWKLVREAIDKHKLPLPDAAICDVGTTVLIPAENDSDTGDNGDSDREGSIPNYQISEDYAQRLRQILRGWKASDVLEQIDALGPAIWPQPQDCQSEFKISFFFELANQEHVCGKVRSWINDSGAPVSIVVSKQIDGPLGLIDVLPKGVHKGFALRWWLEHHDRPLEAAVYCGDSGNDSAAMNCGVNGVVVANADHHLRSAMEALDSPSIYFAVEPSTAGVLEGLLHFSEISLA
ncbi:HAD-IIB family hydrolase [Roseiconus lacunae]|uniref:HAD-IIB family hydrolase n=1 Tax=Roseiconus lacunae TaxID=2605694 RepID=A0ABT7PQU0_9BACT|nr:HAD-IIB family hydrolase [Roseiconus lacunae]MDM4018649.1 HAD-IIB family hydrolase [Roseiconus lacunae]WRQ51418.1 HAD-IIB family hydrolase [Stieleria sp. HD01]